MRPSLRKILIESRVAAVAIAVLIFWTLDYTWWALWGPLQRVAQLLMTGITILDVPYFQFGMSERMMLLSSMLYLLEAVLSLAAARIVSSLVYGRGPLASLAICRAEMTGNGG